VSYRWRGGEELWMRMGAHHPHQILIIEPLFEEKNRTRRLIAEVMRGLDAAGIGSTLPDLPGTGESMIEIADVSFSDWSEAIAAASQALSPLMVAAFRGGALLDARSRHLWRFAPETGARIVRDLKRTQLASNASTPLFAGHALSEAFLAELEAAPLAGADAIRTVRLESDAADADAKVPGTPLWRRAEPGEDAALAAAIVADLSNWVAQCAAS
jgi:hypothetical protein